MYILLFACSPNNNKDPLPLVDDADVYSDNLGESVSWIDPELKTIMRMEKVMEQASRLKMVLVQHLMLTRVQDVTKHLYLEVLHQGTEIYGSLRRKDGMEH